MNDTSHNRRWHWRAVSAIAVLMGCGGGERGPERVAVEGEVTFQGRAVESGSILFVPTDGTPGPRAGAEIDAGQYRLPAARGPVVGRLRVEVRAGREFGYDITEPTESVRHIGEPLPPESIPPEYNDRSTLVVETMADADNTFVFHLPLNQ